MHPKPPKNNVGLRAKKSPAAPPAYRPQPLPQVLQRKVRTPVQQTRWPGRTVQLAEAPPQPPPQPPPGPAAAGAAAAGGAKRKIGGLSDAEALKRRNSKFAKDNEALAAEKNQKQQEIQDLRDAVDHFDRDRKLGRVKFVCLGGAYKHGYRDPIDTFEYEFNRANYSDLQARWRSQNELEITVIMGGGKTVSGSYENGVFTVAHCGEVQGGIGYGIRLSGP